MTGATLSVQTSLIVLAKEPLPGRVKTRLTPPYSPAEAAALAAAALRDTLAAVDATPARARMLAFDGDPTGWCPPGWTHVEQPQGSLDLRIAHAFAHAGPGPAVLVGMDTPQLTSRQLASFDPVAYDAAIGFADDGGYWAIGLADARVAAQALPGVPMSTDQTGAAQMARLLELGLHVQILEPLTDVDTADDAHRVAESAPDTAFAAAFRTCAVRLPA